ncbi:hypothetical protein [[Pseudomonas] boreopolis]|uniref:hypothetical protein n=1 Tax=Xanthomonas boreopolis TaxID=86183 RepID=UPI003DA1172C
MLRLIQEAAQDDADALYPLLASLLDIHLDAAHGDEAANARIRDCLDEIELLFALEIERARLRARGAEAFDAPGSAGLRASGAR